jgi:hypothetical protein
VIAAVIVAVGLYVLATMIYLTVGETAAVQQLWIGSWIALVVGMWQAAGRARRYAGV